MSSRGQNLPAGAALAGWLREPISFGGQMSGEAKNRDGELCEGVAGRCTRTWIHIDNILSFRLDDNMLSLCSMLGKPAIIEHQGIWKI
jgi:hypothetical protein